MLELILLFKILFAQIFTGSNNNSIYIAEPRFISKLAFSIANSNLVIIYKFMLDKAVKPQFNDTKLQYVHDRRREFQVCKEGINDRDDTGSYGLLEHRTEYSQVYQIDSQKYILEFNCYPGAYNFYNEYLLYSIKDYGIEVKPLQLMRISSQEKIDLNEQLVWSYYRGARGSIDFNPQNLTLKVNTIRNHGGYRATYKFDEDEFKLVEYTIVSFKNRKFGERPNVKTFTF
ncbi:hypothetical protein [Pseudanabaena sp. 'Roaring Creek']|uniref:hypothetical protein n=1 Tax=Pseudanabaena sp. 'Roaring Creek' TaxID=1681830 RepID=UPI0006D7B73E|nr:hypothetical protein [Pseudanabaena sp. 'Roaring Creek']